MQAVFCFAAFACGGVQAPETVLSPSVVDWERELPVAGATAVLLDDRVLLFSGYRVNSSVLETTEPDLSVGRIDTRTGELEWERELVARGGSPTFSLVGSVVIAHHGSAVEALDSRTGRYLWGAAFDEAPRLAAGNSELVILLLANGIVNARDTRSGRSVWTIDTGDWTWDQIHATGDELYAIGTSGTDVGVFRASFPSATPLWTARLSGDVSDAWAAGTQLFGRIGGTELRRVSIRTGDEIGEALENQNGWSGAMRLETENVQGLILRMQRIEAYSADDQEAPSWSTTVPSTSTFSGIRMVLSERGVFLNSQSSSVLLDAGTGDVVWRVPASSDSGRCTTLGTTGHALLRACGQLSSRRVVAEEIVQ